MPEPPSASPAAPPSDQPRDHRHASAVAWCGRGVLILGPSGAGKSALLVGLMAAGAYLVADDLVRLVRRGPTLLATAVPPAGLIELRGNGIFRVATTGWVPVNLCVELASPNGHERLPERRTTAIRGADVPCLRLVSGAPPPHGVAAILLALAARRVG